MILGKTDEKTYETMGNESSKDSLLTSVCIVSRSRLHVSFIPLHIVALCSMLLLGLTNKYFCARRRKLENLLKGFTYAIEDHYTMYNENTNLAGLVKFFSAQYVSKNV